MQGNHFNSFPQAAELKKQKTSSKLDNKTGRQKLKKQAEANPKIKENKIKLRTKRKGTGNTGKNTEEGQKPWQTTERGKTHGPNKSPNN